LNQRAINEPDAPPINFGAASRPIEAPAPTTTSDTSEVSRLRRIDSSPSPLHTASSISERSFFKKRRMRYHETAPMTPAMTNERTRRAPETAATAAW
jgi:hypothetical protein